MDEPRFVYGTLRDPEVQRRVIGRLMNGNNDTLIGYETSQVMINNIVYPILVPKEGSVIHGEVLHVSAEELAKIDEYETDAYRRVKIELESGSRAWVYLK